MCGIIGLFSPKWTEPVPMPELLQRMTDMLAHRGPDDVGGWIDIENRIGLGHRRLSIVDLSPLGNQPMVSKSGRFVLVYNGEIYNFRALRTRLEREGVKFRGSSDTEVLLEAFALWGINKTLREANGMFALALWDRQHQTLTLARDRLGEKPLYYYFNNNIFIFGSELKALRAFPGLRAEINLAALNAFLERGYIPSPETIYKNVFKLPPGHLLEARKNNRTIRISPPKAFWSLANCIEATRAEHNNLSENEAIDELNARLEDAVRIRMIADVPLGAFLSGGIDSTTVTALMQSCSNRPIKTFSIGFKDQAYNEATDAARIAKYLGTDHHEEYFDEKDLLEYIPCLPDVFDEPFADPSQLPTMLLARMTRQHVTVALSGDGGDELFGGYTRHHAAARLHRIQTFLPQWCRSVIGGMITTLPQATWDRLSDRLARICGKRPQVRLAGDKMHKFGRIIASDHNKNLYDAVVDHWGGNSPISRNLAIDAINTWWGKPDIMLQPPEEFMYVDAVSYLPDDILVKVDRATMAVSLEGRVPLLDHRAVEYAWSLPLSMKLRGTDGKWILKKILERMVPRKLWDRPKMGFSVPIGQWLRGPLREWTDDLLHPARLKREGYLDAGLVTKLWNRHKQGQIEAGYRLWHILMFQAWLDKWMQ